MKDWVVKIKSNTSGYYNMIVQSTTAEQAATHAARLVPKGAIVFVIERELFKREVERGFSPFASETNTEEYLCLAFGDSMSVDFIKADTPKEAVEECKKRHLGYSVECYKKINISWR